MPRIRVVDTETQGLEPEHKVCELGWCDLTLDGDRWVVGDPRSTLCKVDDMPPAARAAHHISVAETQGFPPFEPVWMWLQLFHDGVDVVAAHNAAFDAARWGEVHLPLLCTYKGALRVWPEAPSHSNGALRYWLEDQRLLSLEHAKAMPPHRAGPDAYVTAHILKAMLQVETARQMVAWTREPALMPRCPIGKFRGKPWAEVEGGFLQWMLKQADMEADLRWNAGRELERRRVAA